MDLRISVVITTQAALGLMLMSPVMSPTSPNSSDSSLNFWLLRACMESKQFRLKTDYIMATTDLPHARHNLNKQRYLYGGRVKHPLLFRKCFGYCILCHSCLSGRRMSCYQHILIPLLSQRKQIQVQSCDTQHWTMSRKNLPRRQPQWPGRNQAGTDTPLLVVQSKMVPQMFL